MGIHSGEVRLIARRVEIPGNSLDDLQQKIGIAFRDPSLLQEALTHSSFANESPHLSPRDNERLEYLGDAVLQLITAEYLYKVRPDAAEGELTQQRSAMVNTNTLAQLSEELGIGDYLYLGKGILKGGGRNLRSLLANAFESVLGAVFLDAGYDAAYHFYLDRFRQMPEPVGDENHKGRLQQVVQERYGQTPYYDSAASRGQGNRREYTAVVYAGNDALGTGHGVTKQAAEQEAARAALAGLGASIVSAEVGVAAPSAPVSGADEAAPKPARARRPRARRAATMETGTPNALGEAAPAVEPAISGPATHDPEQQAPTPRLVRIPRPQELAAALEPATPAVALPVAPQAPATPAPVAPQMLPEPRPNPPAPGTWEAVPTEQPRSRQFGEVPSPEDSDSGAS